MKNKIVKNLISAVVGTTIFTPILTTNCTSSSPSDPSLENEPWEKHYIPKECLDIQDGVLCGFKNIEKINMNYSILFISRTIKSIAESAFSYAFRTSRGGMIIEHYPYVNSIMFSEDSTLESIGDWAFNLCTSFQNSLILPKSLSSIGDNAFAGNRFASIAIEDGNRYFDLATNVGSANVVVPKASRGESSIMDDKCLNVEGALAVGELTIPNTVTEIWDGAFDGCKGLIGELSLPSSLTKIGHSSFNGCSGLSGTLVIPNSVEQIDDLAFKNCIGFDQLTLSENPNFTIIPNSAFSGCSSLKGELNIPSNITSINDDAFSWCSGYKGSLTIPQNVLYVGKRAFEQTNFSSLILTNSNIFVGERAFFDCTSLQNISANFEAQPSWDEDNKIFDYQRISSPKFAQGTISNSSTSGYTSQMLLDYLLANCSLYPGYFIAN